MNSANFACDYYTSYCADKFISRKIRRTRRLFLKKNSIYRLRCRWNPPTLSQATPRRLAQWQLCLPHGSAVKLAHFCGLTCSFIAVKTLIKMFREFCEFCVRLLYIVLLINLFHAEPAEITELPVLESLVHACAGIHRMALVPLCLPGERKSENRKLAALPLHAHRSISFNPLIKISVNQSNLSYLWSTSSSSSFSVLLNLPPLQRGAAQEVGCIHALLACQL